MLGGGSHQNNRQNRKSDENVENLKKYAFNGGVKGGLNAVSGSDNQSQLQNKLQISGSGGQHHSSHKSKSGGNHKQSTIPQVKYIPNQQASAANAPISTTAPSENPCVSAINAFKKSEKIETHYVRKESKERQHLLIQESSTKNTATGRHHQREETQRINLSSSNAHSSDISKPNSGFTTFDSKKSGHNNSSSRPHHDQLKDLGSTTISGFKDIMKQSKHHGERIQKNAAEKHSGHHGNGGQPSSNRHHKHLNDYKESKTLQSIFEKDEANKKFKMATSVTMNSTKQSSSRGDPVFNQKNCQNHKKYDSAESVDEMHKVNEEKTQTVIFTSDNNKQKHKPKTTLGKRSNKDNHHHTEKNNYRVSSSNASENRQSVERDKKKKHKDRKEHEMTQRTAKDLNVTDQKRRSESKAKDRRDREKQAGDQNESHSHVKIGKHQKDGSSRRGKSLGKSHESPQDPKKNTQRDRSIVKTKKADCELFDKFSKYDNSKDQKHINTEKASNYRQNNSQEDSRQSANDPKQQSSPKSTSIPYSQQKQSIIIEQPLTMKLRSKSKERERKPKIQKEVLVINIYKDQLLKDDEQIQSIIGISPKRSKATESVNEVVEQNVNEPMVHEDQEMDEQSVNIDFKSGSKFDIQNSNIDHLSISIQSKQKDIINQNNQIDQPAAAATVSADEPMQSQSMCNNTNTHHELLHSHSHSNQTVHHNNLHSLSNAKDQIMEIDDSSQSQKDKGVQMQHKLKQLVMSNKEQIDPIEENFNKEEENQQAEDRAAETVDEMPWGHKMTKMHEDDVIYEMKYSEGSKKNQEIKILLKDINRLEPAVYLNDTLILFFLKFLQNYALSREKVETIHIFNSYFMQMITQNSANNSSAMAFMSDGQGLYGGLGGFDNGFGGEQAPQKKLDIQFNKMKRWTRSVDLFNGKIRHIFVPICENDHWSLAIICNPEKAAQLIEKQIARCEKGDFPNIKTKDESTLEEDKKPGGDPNKSTKQPQQHQENIGGTTQNKQQQQQQQQPKGSEMNSSAKQNQSMKLSSSAPNGATVAVGGASSDTKDPLKDAVKDVVNLDKVDLNKKEEGDRKSEVAERFKIEMINPCLPSKQHFSESKYAEVNTNHADENMNHSDVVDQKKTIEQMFEEGDEDHQNDEMVFKKYGKQPKLNFEREITGSQGFLKERKKQQNGQSDQGGLQTILQQLTNDNNKTNQSNDDVLQNGSTQQNQVVIGNQQKIGQKRVLQSQQYSQQKSKRQKQENDQKIASINKINPTNRGSSASSAGSQFKYDEHQIGEAVFNMHGQNNQDLISKNPQDYNKALLTTSPEMVKGVTAPVNSRQCAGMKQKGRPEQPQPGSTSNNSASTKATKEASAQKKKAAATGAQSSKNGQKSVNGSGGRVQKQQVEKQKQHLVNGKSTTTTTGNSSAVNVSAQKNSAAAGKQTSKTSNSLIQKVNHNQKGTVVAPHPDQSMRFDHQVPPLNISEKNNSALLSKFPNLLSSSTLNQEPNTIHCRDKDGGGRNRMRGTPRSSDDDEDDNSSNGIDDDTYKQIQRHGHIDNDQQHLQDDEVMIDEFQHEMIDDNGMGPEHDVNLFENQLILNRSKHDQQQQRRYDRFNEQHAGVFKHDLNEGQSEYEDEGRMMSMGSQDSNSQENVQMEQQRLAFMKAKNQIGGNSSLIKQQKMGSRYFVANEQMSAAQRQKVPYHDNDYDEHSGSRRNRGGYLPEEADNDKLPHHFMNNEPAYDHDQNYYSEDEYDSEADNSDGMGGFQNDEMFSSKFDGLGGKFDNYGLMGSRDKHDFHNLPQNMKDLLDSGHHLGHGFSSSYGRGLDHHDMGGFDLSARINHFHQSRPLEPKMPEEAESEKPFILYLDSLNTSVNSTNMQCLRQYIEMEYIDKKLKNDQSKVKWLSEEYGWKGLKRDNMPHYLPDVPRQKNLTDCGLYLLENAEAFIRDPDFIIKNLHQKNVKLFKTRLVEDKRDILKRIITGLAENQEQANNQETIGQKYQLWRDELYQKMTHYQNIRENNNATSAQQAAPQNRNPHSSSASHTNADKPQPQSSPLPPKPSISPPQNPKPTAHHDHAHQPKPTSSPATPAAPPQSNSHPQQPATPHSSTSSPATTTPHHQIPPKHASTALARSHPAPPARPHDHHPNVLQAAVSEEEKSSGGALSRDEMCGLVEQSAGQAQHGVPRHVAAGAVGGSGSGRHNRQQQQQV